MERETPIGHSVSVFSESASYDAAIKRLLSHKQFLARIMKECLPEYRDCSLSDIMDRYIEGEAQVASIGVDADETNPCIRGANTEDKTLTEGTVFYDIRFDALAPKDDDLIRIIINVEAQDKSDPGYSLLRRAIYYCSRMISAQKSVEFTGSDYDGIKKVYSIWVCTNAPENEKATITTYSMKEESLIGSVVKDPEEYDLLSVIMIRLGDMPLHEDGSVNADALDANVLGMLEVLLKGRMPAAQKKDILESHYGIAMTKQIQEEVGQMCNLSQGILEEGIERARVDSVKALMETMHLTLEQAMQLLKYPMSDKEKIAAALN